MLRITIELLPHGREDKKRVIGYGTIANVSNPPRGNDATEGDYRMDLFSSVPPRYTRHITGTLENYPREKSFRGLWSLVRDLLHETLEP